MDRERLCNDILNTGVMAALIGGFALSSLQTEYNMNEGLDVAIYVTAFVGVHACTCSSVTSALLYRYANALRDEDAPSWAASHSFLLSLPMAKFGIGCVSYLLSVVLLSFRDLDTVPFWQKAALLIGLMSMSMTLAIGTWLLTLNSGQTPIADIAMTNPARKSSD